MLLTQPPVISIIWHTYTVGTWHLVNRKFGAAGVTIADVIDVAATCNPEHITVVDTDLVYRSRYDANNTSANLVLDMQKDITVTLEAKPEVDSDFFSDSDSEI